MKNSENLINLKIAKLLEKDFKCQLESRNSNNYLKVLNSQYGYINNDDG